LPFQLSVRTARLTGKYNGGALDGSSSAAVVLWLDDTNADGAIETNECALLEYDPSTRSLLYRTVPSTGSTASMTYDTFANGSSVIADMHSAASKTQPVANNLDGAVFYSTPGDGSTDRPMLEFTLKFQRRQDSADNSSEAIGESLVGYGVATVRTPLQRPNP
jgi:hypothetical protein